jgi:hypothetical protein
MGAIHRTGSIANILQKGIGRRELFLFERSAFPILSVSAPEVIFRFLGQQHSPLHPGEL